MTCTQKSTTQAAVASALLLTSCLAVQARRFLRIIPNWLNLYITTQQTQTARRVCLLH